MTAAGTAWINALVDPGAGNTNHLASTTGVEVVAAIARRTRGGTIPAPAAKLMLLQFDQEYRSEYLIVEISSALITHAMTLAETYALRGYDAVQLAAALETASRYAAAGLQLTLVSADVDLNAVASAVGLLVEDPHTHP